MKNVVKNYVSNLETAKEQTRKMIEIAEKYNIATKEFTRAKNRKS